MTLGVAFCGGAAIVKQVPSMRQVARYVNRVPACVMLTVLIFGRAGQRLDSIFPGSYSEFGWMMCRHGGAPPPRDGHEVPVSEEQQDIPKKFGEFEIGIRLGVGGMGQVFKARQASLDREVALKVLPAHSAQNQEMKERFFREARSAAKLVHPNVVQVYAVGEENNVPYFAMEYVRGADLAKRLEQGQQFSTSEILNIASSVVMALAAAEEHGIGRCGDFQKHAGMRFAFPDERLRQRGECGEEENNPKVDGGEQRSDRHSSDRQ